MIAFIIVALLVLLSVITWLALPLLAPRKRSSEGVEAPALRILREQRRELDGELAAGRISAAEHAETLAELEVRTATEMQGGASVNRPEPARGWALGLALALPLAAIGLYLVLGQPAGLDPARTAPQQALGPADIEKMVAGLAARVEANPEDLEATQMLARSYMVLQRYPEAVEVYRKLAQRTPDDAQLYADWADALASANGNSMNGEPEKLVQRALQLDPENVKALALAGSLAFERKDYQEAKRLWTRMNAHVDPESEIGQSARAMLDEVARRLGEAPAAQSAPQPAAASGLPLRGEIRLADSLAQDVKPGDTLFVFVHHAAGGPPVAALRLEAGQWPLHFDFSQASLMGGAAGEGPWVIGARISRSGTATAAKGDPEGFSEEIPANSAASANVVITLDRRHP